MDAPLVETVQLKLLYAGVYLTMGLISPSQLEILELEAWKLRKQKISMKQYAGYKSHLLFPTVEQIAAEFGDNLHGLPNGVVVEKWRWMTRDSCDKLLLRFIRSFKNLKHAAAQLGNAIYLQVEKCDGEQELSRGERYYIETEPDKAYIDQLVQQKIMFCGADKSGCPLLAVRVCKHFPRKQSRQALTRLLVVVLEHLYLTQSEEMDGSTIIFDLHGFTLENLDLDFTKMMVEWATKVYPGVLSRIYVHRAPKVFEGVWHLVKKLLDPEVRGMIKFSYTVRDLQEDVSLEMIPAYMGGESIYTGEWTDLRSEDDALLQDHKGRDHLVAKRHKLHGEIEHLTRNWIMAHDNYIMRQNCLARTQMNFWLLDPYVRSRTVWDRQGVLYLTRPELGPGGISHVPTVVAQLSAPPQKPVAALSTKSSGKSSPQSVPGLSCSTPSISSLATDSVAPLFFNDSFSKPLATPVAVPHLVRPTNSDHHWSFLN